MKDTPSKPVPSIPKSKPGPKKEKMPVKKLKEPKPVVPKATKGRKSTSKSPEKKLKPTKGNETQPKKKRGRPKSEQNLQKQKNSKETKSEKSSKKADGKPAARKRKLPLDKAQKVEKDTSHPPTKKIKLNNIHCNMNGNAKLLNSGFHKANSQTPSNFSEAAIKNNVNNVPLKNALETDSHKSSTSSTSKNVTFDSNPKAELLNGGSMTKASKITPKNIKGILKNELPSNHQTKESAKASPKSNKVEKVNNSIAAFKSPIKLHPQRMASLDALAKMHVICIPDRKPIEHHTKSTTSVVTTVCSEPFTHQKSLTQCHERIQVDVKKESKGNFVHKQINVVKEKQHVFVSHSVEQSKTVSSKTSGEKRNRQNPSLKSSGNASKNEQKLNQIVSCHSKSVTAFPIKAVKKSKAAKIKDAEKASAKSQAKSPKAYKSSAKEKPNVKATSKTLKTLEQTKSEVKVKETIRMQKTCTYQSVTTVNSHGSTDSIVVPVSRVGMTTNFSKTKKTVVTDEDCKNKISYSSDSIVNNTYCVTSESPCSLSHHADCCKFHARTSPRVIPFAHVQTCSLGHGLARSPDASSSPSHYDSNFPVHRFGHQQTLVYSSPPQDYGYCCPGNVNDPCIIRKSILSYPQHAHHHPHNTFTSDSFCADCHHGSTALDTSRHRQAQQHFSGPSSSHSKMGCYTCCDLTSGCSSSASRHQSDGSCLRYLSASKSSAGLMSCEQSPLDLSLASTSSGSSMEPDLPLQRGHCPSPLCCAGDVLVVRTSTPHGFQHSQLPSVASCHCVKRVSCCDHQNAAYSCGHQDHLSAASQNAAYSCGHQPVDHLSAACGHQPVDHQNAAYSCGHQPVDHLSAASSAKESHLPPAVSTVTSKHQASAAALVPPKREKNISPKHSAKVLATKRRQFAHGWSWKGKPKERLIALTNDSPPTARLCYPSVEHQEGDVINEKDCVLLKSGPKDTDLPYVAKVAAFWENPDDGEMMMSLLWYYRPEHTDQGRKPGQMEDEVFASRHKDVNSIACIEDKCYVLTYNEYCRYKAKMSMEEDMVSMSTRLVPDIVEGYSRKGRLPLELVASDLIFCCRHVYDFRQKRLLKNPT